MVLDQLHARVARGRPRPQWHGSTQVQSTTRFLIRRFTAMKRSFQQQLTRLQAELDHERTLRQQIEEQAGHQLAQLQAENRELHQRLATSQSQEMNREEDAHFAWAILNSLATHIAVLDDTGTIIATNEAWRKFATANISVEEPTNTTEGANYLSVCDLASGSNAHEAPFFAAGIRAVLNKAQDYFALEYPCHSPDEQRWFIGHVTQLVGLHPACVVTAHENITSRKLAELRLQESEARLRRLSTELETANQHLHYHRNFLQTIIDAVDEGFVLLNQEGYVQTANRAATLLLHRALDALLNQPWDALCQSSNPDLAPAFPTDWVRETLRDGQPRRHREHVRYPDATTRVLDMQALPIGATSSCHTEQTCVAQVVLHIVDVTERLLKESQARRNERAIASKAITALLSHRVNTPLQTILSTLEMIAENDNIEHVDMLVRAQEQIERISSILRDMEHRSFLQEASPEAGASSGVITPGPFADEED